VLDRSLTRVMLSTNTFLRRKTIPARNMGTAWLQPTPTTELALLRLITARAVRKTLRKAYMLCEVDLFETV